MTELQIGRASPNDRIKVFPVAMAAPGKCVVCGYSGGDPERQFVDIGFDLDYYGVIYWCTQCVTEVSNKLGYANPDQVSQLITENMTLSDKVLGLTNERDNLKSSLRNLLNDSTAVGAVAESEILPEPKSNSKKPSPRLTNTESTVDNTISKQRSDDSSNFDGDSITLGG